MRSGMSGGKNGFRKARSLINAAAANSLASMAFAKVANISALLASISSADRPRLADAGDRSIARRMHATDHRHSRRVWQNHAPAPRTRSTPSQADSWAFFRQPETLNRRGNADATGSIDRLACTPTFTQSPTPMPYFAVDPSRSERFAGCRQVATNSLGWSLTSRLTITLYGVIILALGNHHQARTESSVLIALCALGGICALVSLSLSIDAIRRSIAILLRRPLYR